VDKIKCNVHTCDHGMARSRVADGGDGFRMWTIDANVLNEQSSGLGVGREAKNSSLYKLLLVTNCHAGPRNWWALVNTVMSLRVPYNAGNFVTSRVTIFQVGLCPVEVDLDAS
jgi:hypothetical protein